MEKKLRSNILPNGVFQTFSDWLIVFKKSDSNRQHFVQRWALVLNLPLTDKTTTSPDRLHRSGGRAVVGGGAWGVGTKAEMHHLWGLRLKRVTSEHKDHDKPMTMIAKQQDARSIWRRIWRWNVPVCRWASVTLPGCIVGGASVSVGPGNQGLWSCSSERPPPHQESFKDHTLVLQTMLLITLSLH